MFTFLVFELNFGKDLVPFIVGYCGTFDGEKWIFQDGIISDHLIKMLHNLIIEDGTKEGECSLIDESRTLEGLNILSPSVSRTPSSPCITPSSPKPVTSGQSTAPSTPVSRPKSVPTVYQDQDWLKKMKSNFYAEIIAPCSTRANKAVEDNLYIEVLILSNALVSK